jgi:hypothetical protein
MRLKSLIFHNVFTFTAKLIKKHANIHIWICKDALQPGNGEPCPIDSGCPGF